jgi:hypothetical protein
MIYQFGVNITEKYLKKQFNLSAIKKHMNVYNFYLMTNMNYKVN